MSPLPDISLCMIIRNEESHLRRCLESVKGLVSEIILGDTGCDDRSVEIALSFGARVIPVLWEDDFAKARNQVLEHASASWILTLDADEQLMNADAEYLVQLTECKSVTGYSLTIHNLLDDKPNGEFISDSICRLFRRDPRIRYQGCIHENITDSISNLPDSLIADANLIIRHFGYTPQELAQKNKSRRNLELISRALEMAPDDLWLRYALGTEYYQLEQYSDAAVTLLPLLRKFPADEGCLPDIYLKAAYALYRCHNTELGEQTLRDGIALYPDFADLRELLVLFYLSDNHFISAKQELNQILQLKPTASRYSSYSGSGSYYTYYLLGKTEESLINYEQAVYCYIQALRCKPNYKPAWAALSTICLWEDRIPLLTELTQEHISEFDPELLAMLLPAALNSSSSAWIKVLCSSPVLDPLTVQAAERIREYQENGMHPAIMHNLMVLHQQAPEHKMILFYLWALCMTAYEDLSQAASYLELLITDYPGLADLQSIIEENDQASSISPLPLREYSCSEKDFHHAVQVFAQLGAWGALLCLYQHNVRRFHWSELPHSVLIRFLKAPLPSLTAWKSIYEKTQLAALYHRDPASLDLAEWMLYAAVSERCGSLPIIPLQIQDALQSSRKPAARLFHVYILLTRASFSCPKGTTLTQPSCMQLLLSFLSSP